MLKKNHELGAHLHQKQMKMWLPGNNLAEKSSPVFLYAPNLALCDWFLFSKIKTCLNGHHFGTVNIIHRALG